MSGGLVRVSVNEQINIYSWPRLWVYWPMYVALACSQSDGLTFTIDSEPSDSDEQIRARLGEYLSQNPDHLAMALCEPGNVRGQPDSAFTRIPLLWRMPHWKIRPCNTDSDIETVLCYKDRTTSGVYVRDQFPGKTYRDLNVDKSLAEQLNHPNTIAASFTPYQRIEKGLCADDKYLPGPDRDVTALLVPTGRQNGTRIADTILENTKRVLHQLTATNGLEAKVRQLVEGYQDRINPLYPQTSFPGGSYNLAELLAEYVRQGCYFPYRVVSSALLGELRRIAKKNIEEAVEEAYNRASEDLVGFLGVGKDWSELSFEQRRNVLTSEIEVRGSALFY